MMVRLVEECTVEEEHPVIRFLVVEGIKDCKIFEKNVKSVRG